MRLIYLNIFIRFLVINLSLMHQRQQHRGGRLYLVVLSSPRLFISCFSPPHHMRLSSTNLEMTMASYTLKQANRSSVDLGRNTINVITNGVTVKSVVTQIVQGI